MLAVVHPCGFFSATRVTTTSQGFFLFSLMPSPVSKPEKAALTWVSKHHKNLQYRWITASSFQKGLAAYFFLYPHLMSSALLQQASSATELPICLLLQNSVTWKQTLQKGKKKKPHECPKWLSLSFFSQCCQVCSCI